MAISQSLTLNWVRQGESITQTVTISADGEHNFETTVPNATTDQQNDITLDVSELKLVYIHSDKAITIEANDGTTPAFTLSVAANKPLIWYTGCGWTNPLTADVTAFFITNNSGATATVKMRFLEDSTP